LLARLETVPRLDRWPTGQGPCVAHAEARATAAVRACRRLACRPLGYPTQARAPAVVALRSVPGICGSRSLAAARRALRTCAKGLAEPGNRVRGLRLRRTGGAAPLPPVSGPIPEPRANPRYAVGRSAVVAA